LRLFAERPEHSQPIELDSTHLNRIIPDGAGINVIATVTIRTGVL
jgi:hypothetical protein